MRDEPVLSFSIGATPLAPATARAAVTRFVRPADGSTLTLVGDLVAAVVGDAVRALPPYSTDVVDVAVGSGAGAIRVELRGRTVAWPSGLTPPATRSGTDRNGTGGVWFEIDVDPSGISG